MFVFWRLSYLNMLSFILIYLFAVYTSVHITNLDVPRTYILEREEFITAFSAGHRHPLVHIESEPDESSSSSPAATPTIPDTSFTATAAAVAASNISSSSGNSNDGKSSHEIKPLIMDCQYEIKANECGFVLKWYFNKKLIYQWIPARNPVGMVSD